MGKKLHNREGRDYSDEEDIRYLLGSLVRREFDERGVLNLTEKTHRIILGIHGAIGEFVKIAAGRRPADAEPMSKLLGLSRRDSSLMLEPLGWAMSLHEPIATKTIARLLMMGSDEMRAQRMQAFLLALGIKYDADALGPADRNNYMTYAEVPAGDRRIDLKLVWRDQKQKERVLIIEAKFKHHVTDGQLKCYREKMKEAHPNAKHERFILGLDEGVYDGKKTDPHGKWKFCSWTDLWLRFEELRPDESDLSLRLFMRTLWMRIGGMNARDANAGL